MLFYSDFVLPIIPTSASRAVSWRTWWTDRNCRHVQTLINALCGPSTGSSLPGCAISVRVSEDEKSVEEYYEVTGSPRFPYSRSFIFSSIRYDAVIFVYDATDGATRSSVSCTWVPQVMRFLGDVGAIESGGRLDGTDVHVRSAGVIHELRFLWRQAFFSQSAVSIRDALTESVQLVLRLFKLLSNETGVWSDSSIDRQAEAAFLSTSRVPVAIVGMKSDLLDSDDALGLDYDSSTRNVSHIHLQAQSVASDTRLRTFLVRVADQARRRTCSVNTPRSQTSATSAQVMLGFMWTLLPQLYICGIHGHRGAS